MPDPIDPAQTVAKPPPATEAIGLSPSISIAADATVHAPSGTTPSTESGDLGTLGPYRVVKKLGAGGMGAVFLAEDTRLNRKLALKVMLPEFAADAAAKERFLREARAAAQISHDNVVTVYEADERDGIPFIAMQLLRGYSLDDYLKKKGNPSLSHIFRIAHEIAAGLAAAHALGLVHRDIKPANLWLEAPNGRVKVLDFGLAKPVSSDCDLTRTGVLVGSPAYMSPEQARGEKVDARSDLFSLGAVLYWLCTGRTPFERPNVMAMLIALGTEEPTPVRALNPNVPEAAATLIHKLLAKNPADRFSSSKEFSIALADVLRPPKPVKSPESDNQIKEDWDELRRVIMAAGSSTQFYKERGARRIEAWKQATEHNDPMGMVMYARCLQEGIGGPKDLARAAELFHKAADLGNTLGIVNLAWCYQEGSGVSKDMREAIRWARQAADLGEPVAVNYLGCCSEDGLGVTKDTAEAVKWYRKAAGMGYSRAMVALGLCYQNGVGIERNSEEAVRWFQKAAVLGNGDAMERLATCYDCGCGVTKNEEEAVWWYRKAAAMDDINSMVTLAARMIDGDGHVARSPLEAMNLLTKAQGHASDWYKYRILEYQVRAGLRLGVDDLKAGRFTQARARLDAAGVTSEALNQERPGRFYFMQDLAEVWFEFGNLELAEGNARGATANFERAIAVDGPEMMTKAAEALADLLSQGRGVPRDEAKADQLRSVAGMQSSHKISLPCWVNGTTQKRDFFIFEVFPWKHPLETQFRYYKEERECTVPPEVMESFGRLHQMAKENAVLFTELVRYAMEETEKIQKEKKDKKEN